MMFIQVLMKELERMLTHVGKTFDYGCLSKCSRQIAS